MPIDVACACGMRSRAPDQLAGQRAKCPGCGNVMVVPARSHPGGVLPSVAAPAPAPQPSAGFSGNPALGAPRSPVAFQPKPQPATGIPAVVWVAIAGGVGLVAVLFLAVVVWLVSADGEQVAEVPPAFPPGGGFVPPLQTAIPPLPTQFPTPSSSPSFSPPSFSPAPSSASPSSTAPLTAGPMPASTLPGSGALNTPVQPPALQNVAPPSSSPIPSITTKPKGESLAALWPAMETWRTGDKPRRGMQRFPDKMPTLGYSWMTDLLPFLGEGQLAGKFDRSKSWAESGNLQLTSKSIPAFLNPADPRKQWDGYPFDNMGLSHYVGMAGIEDGRNVVAGELPRSDPRAGVFGYDEVAKLDEITDGASQTIAVIGSGNLVSPWVQGGGATIRGARAPYFDEITGFGSKGLSRPGAQVLMADGSVRAISADIDPQVFKALCTMHGAETVDLQSATFSPTDAPPVAAPEADSSTP